MKMPYSGLHSLTGSRFCLFPIILSSLCTHTRLVLLQVLAFLFLPLAKLFSGSCLAHSFSTFKHLLEEVPLPLWVKELPPVPPCPRLLFPSFPTFFPFLPPGSLSPILSYSCYSLHLPLLELYLFFLFSFNCLSCPYLFKSHRHRGFMSCSWLYLDCLQHLLVCSRHSISILTWMTK